MKRLVAGIMILSFCPTLALAGFFEWEFEYYDGGKTHLIRLRDGTSVFPLPNDWVCETAPTFKDVLKKLGRKFQVEHKSLLCAGPNGDKIEIDGFCEYNSEIHQSDLDAASVVLYSKGEIPDIRAIIRCKTKKS